MKGYRFYLEYPEGVNPNKFTRKNLGTHSGTVVALSTDRPRAEKNGDKYELIYDAVNGVQDIPNSPVCTGSVSQGYLRERTKRISEAQAREIHPNIFCLLD